jgi:hypothetical protein
MAAIGGKNTINYEKALRVIGRHLDAEPTFDVSITEVDDGFTVRYRPAVHRADEFINHFTWERLGDLIVFFSSGRGLIRKRGRYQGIWAALPHGHQGFLRALGNRLDTDRACCLHLAEVSGGVQVSYGRPDKADKGDLEQSQYLVSEKEIKSMLLTAERRRA